MHRTHSPGGATTAEFFVGVIFRVSIRKKTSITIVPYILAYKSQNLRQNLDLKVRGATYTRVTK